MASIAPHNLTLIPTTIQNMPPSTQAPGWATKEAWDRYKPLIVQLYAKNKLGEVMRIMERDHGFRATIKMYKNHITAWGLDKKHKENEMRAIIRKNQQRSDQSKASKFEIRERPVHFAEVVRYWKRKGISVEEVLARRTASLTPEALRCLTPVTSPLSTPRELAVPERILKSIRDYFHGSFDSGTWVKTEPLSDCYSKKEAIVYEGNPYELWDQIDTVNTLFSLKRFADAVQALNVACSHIKGILQSERPETLSYIFSSVNECLRRGNHGIATVILRQFCCLGSVVLGPEHPLGIVCGSLASLETIYWAELLLKALESIIVCLKAVLGPMHITTLEYDRVRMDIEVTIDARQATIKAKQALQALETQLDPYDHRLAFLREVFANVLIREQNYIEAEQVAQEMLLYAPPGEAGIDIRARGLYIQAFVHKIYGETFEAELKLRETIDTYVAPGAAFDGLAKNYLVIYAGWLIEWGCPGEADRVFLTASKMAERVEML